MKSVGNGSRLSGAGTLTILSWIDRPHGTSCICAGGTAELCGSSGRFFGGPVFQEMGQYLHDGDDSDGAVVYTFGFDLAEEIYPPSLLTRTLLSEKTYSVLIV